MRDVVRTGSVIETGIRGTRGGLKRLYKKYLSHRVVVVVAEVLKADCWIITTYAEED
ncbi:MAG: hypothetical protein RL324_929 [Verrucomicrobiota bacterium]